MGKRQEDLARRRESPASAIRVGLPATIGLVGIALMVLADDASLLGAGIVRSERDREREAWARRYFDRHGRWPQRDARP